MFTGLVEGIGEVARIVRKGRDAVLCIASPWPLAEAVLGESVAVNGACLTVTGAASGGFNLDVSAESLSRTTLGRLVAGSKVNLERALQMGGRLGGHLVSGHVDCVGQVSGLARVGESLRLSISMPPEHLRFVVEKGSVAVEGVSLTVNRVSESGFELNIIPHTMAATTLPLVRQGDSVNIETDLIGKYVARLLAGGQGRGDQKDKGGLTRGDLAKAGF